MNFTYGEVNGFFWVRDGSIQDNPHNRDGITLAAIKHEFEIAQILYKLKAANVPIKKLSADEVQKWIQNKYKLTEMTAIGPDFESLNLDRFVLEDDDELAEQISECPVLLMLSPVHQDALSRWTYTQHYSCNRDLEVEAKRLLKNTHRKRDRNRRRKWELDQSHLIRIHNDMLAYGRYVVRCIEEDCNTMDDLMKYFPDIEDISDVLTTQLKDGIPLKRKHTVVTASEIANKYLSSLMGISTATLSSYMEKGKQSNG